MIMITITRDMLNKNANYQILASLNDVKMWMVKQQPAGLASD